MAINQGITGWRRREAKKETAARREARNPLSREARESIEFWRGVDDEATFVYFAQEEGSSEFVKVGSAKDPVKRIAELQCGNPRRLFVEVVVYGDEETERGLHYLWSQDRVRGDWFRAGEILGYAKWRAQKQRQQLDEGEHLWRIQRTFGKQPSVWKREAA